jgi:hypothetical protein
MDFDQLLKAEMTTGMGETYILQIFKKEAIFIYLIIYTWQNTNAFSFVVPCS